MGPRPLLLWSRRRAEREGPSLLPLPSSRAEGGGSGAPPRRLMASPPGRRPLARSRRPAPLRLPPGWPSGGGRRPRQAPRLLCDGCAIRLPIYFPTPRARPLPSLPPRSEGGQEGEEAGLPRGKRGRAQVRGGGLQQTCRRALPVRLRWGREGWSHLRPLPPHGGPQVGPLGPPRPRS